MPAVLDAKEPKWASAGLGQPKRTGFYLEGWAAGAVERHADKAVVAERLEEMPHVGCSVRVGSACDYIVEPLGRLCEKFPVAGFRNENVHVLVLECGAAREQVLVPQTENPWPKIFGDGQAYPEASHPECAKGGEESCLQRGKFHA